MIRECSGIIQCFNPRARAGRDVHSPHPDIDPARVSIHAPVRGATAGTKTGGCHALVSIHAPVRGATDNIGKTYIVGVVSIHAPVRGATIMYQPLHMPPACFNPRARAGRDFMTTSTKRTTMAFQSTRPCGARLLQTRGIYTISRCFNPRARAGRD